MAIEVLNVDKHQRKMTYDNRGRPSMRWSEMYAKPRLYLSIDMGQDGRKGESAMEHILLDRYSARDLAKYARDNGLIAKALAQAGIEPTTKAIFSQKAGCGCGCSPALILQLSPNSSFDLWVTIGDPDLIAKAAPYREATKFIQAIKAGRSLVKNARKSGLPVVNLKELSTYWSADPNVAWKTYR